MVVDSRSVTVAWATCATGTSRQHGSVTTRHSGIGSQYVQTTIKSGGGAIHARSMQISGQVNMAQSNLQQPLYWLALAHCNKRPQALPWNYQDAARVSQSNTCKCKINQAQTSTIWDGVTGALVFTEAPAVHRWLPKSSLLFAPFLTLLLLCALNLCCCRVRLTWEDNICDQRSASRSA